MNVTSNDIFRTSIAQCRSVLAESVFDNLPAGELVQACDINCHGIDATKIMQCLTTLKAQGRVQTYKFKQIQLWGRVDEFSNT